jgi:hypothetical protein
VIVFYCGCELDDLELIMLFGVGVGAVGNNYIDAEGRGGEVDGDKGVHPSASAGGFVVGFERGGVGVVGRTVVVMQDKTVKIATDAISVI